MDQYLINETSQHYKIYLKLKMPVKDYIEAAYYTEQTKKRTITEYKCPNYSQRSKQIINTMRISDPLGVAMDVYSN